MSVTLNPDDIDHSKSVTLEPGDVRVEKPTDQGVPLRGGGVMGTVARGVGGLIQGEMDPAQAFGSYIGIGAPDFMKGALARNERIAQTPAGEVGRVAGNIFNPSWAVLGPIRAVQLAGRYGTPVVRAIEELGKRALQGTIAGGIMMPGEDRGTQAGVGGAAAAALGLPGATAMLSGYPSVAAMARAVTSHIPGVSSMFTAFRSLSIPDFNRVWNRYILQPIKGDAPQTAGHAANADVQAQIGKAIDAATRNATFDDALANHIERDLIADRARAGMGEAGERTYTRIIDQYFDKPLAENGGRLQTSQLLKVQSDIEAQMRLMPQTTPEQRAVRRALSDFRLWVIDNATMTAEERAAYASAREAYKRFAISREAVSPTGEEGRFGLFTPDRVMSELDERYPFAVPVGQAPYQGIVGAAQQSLGFPGRAADRAISGQPRLRIILPGLTSVGLPATLAEFSEQVSSALRPRSERK